MNLGSNRCIVTRRVSEDDTAIRCLPRLRFGLLSDPPNPNIILDKALVPQFRPRQYVCDEISRDRFITLKTIIILSLFWTLLILGVGMFGLWYIFENPIRGVRAEDRAAKLGSGTGVLMSLGYAVLWLPFAYKIGKKRREARESR